MKHSTNCIANIYEHMQEVRDNIYWREISPVTLNAAIQLIHFAVLNDMEHNIFFGYNGEISVNFYIGELHNCNGLFSWEFIIENAGEIQYYFEIECKEVDMRSDISLQQALEISESIETHLHYKTLNSCI